MANQNASMNEWSTTKLLLQNAKTSYNLKKRYFLLNNMLACFLFYATHASRFKNPQHKNRWQERPLSTLNVHSSNRILKPDRRTKRKFSSSLQ